LNPVSLFELSVQFSLTWPVDSIAAVRFVGAAGVGVGEGEGKGAGVGAEILLIWTMLATEGTPFEFRMKSI